MPIRGASPYKGDDFFKEVRGGWCSRWMEVRGHGSRPSSGLQASILESDVLMNDDGYKAE